MRLRGMNLASATFAGLLATLAAVPEAAAEGNLARRAERLEELRIDAVFRISTNDFRAHCDLIV